MSPAAESRRPKASIKPARSNPIAKLVLLSVIIAAIAIPISVAREKNPRVGLKKTLIRMVLFNIFYVFALLFLYPRFL